MTAVERGYVAGIRGRTAIPAEVRFWTKVKKTDTCWLWTGVPNDSGYGVLGVGGTRTRPAHRPRELRGRIMVDAHNRGIRPGEMVRQVLERRGGDAA
jgi:hypothetical protein